MNLRHNAMRFFLGITRYYAKYGWIWLLVLLLAVIATHHWRLVYNYTNSLPQTFFFIELGKKDVARGDYIAFYPPKKATAGHEMPFVKKVVCLPGEKLDRFGKDFFCEGVKVASAKAFSLKNEPLVPAEPQVLADDDYFVVGTHPDSFDSRYIQFGPINRCRFIGKAHPIF